MEKASWGGSTNLVSAFEDIILPRAKDHGVKPEDMVKRVFIFSDMQFNQAEEDTGLWVDSYERISAKYEEASRDPGAYLLERWWRRRHRRGCAEAGDGRDTPGTAMVSGYSQGMLKVFLEDGSFGTARRWWMRKWRARTGRL